MKLKAYSGKPKAYNNAIKSVFELTIRINGQKEQTFVFENEDDFVIEQTNNWFTVYFNKKVIISIKLTMLDYMYTGWRFI